MSKPDYLCPGPAEDGSPVWECHGAACPFHHDPDICRPEVERRGYTLSMTDKHRTKTAWLAEQAATQE